MRDKITKYGLILVGVGLAALFWILESVVMVLAFSGENFVEQVLNPDAHEIWMRLIGIGLIIVFAIYAQSAINKRKQLANKLNRHVKELKCIYDITSISEKPMATLDKLYQEVVNLLPSGWRYPEITSARITISGKEYETENYRDSPWRLSSDIKVFGVKAGKVESIYLEKIPELDEGSSLREERLLIDVVADRLGTITERI